jgi:hypothetical protein
VFAVNGQQKRLALTLNGKPVPVSVFQFSNDGRTLEIIAARYIDISIPKGMNTSNGMIGVMLGAPAVPMHCSAKW